MFVIKLKDSIQCHAKKPYYNLYFIFALSGIHIVTDSVEDIIKFYGFKDPSIYNVCKSLGGSWSMPTRNFCTVRLLLRIIFMTFQEVFLHSKLSEGASGEFSDI